MKKILLLMGLVACPFMNAQTVPTVDDARINGGASENINYGAEVSMPCKNSSIDFTRQVLLKFNLSTFDVEVAGDYILRFYSSNAVNLNVYKVANDWVEGSVTWSNQPTELSLLGTIAAPGGEMVELNVTSAATAAMEADDLLSVRIIASDSEGYTEIKSKEFATSFYHPVVEKVESLSVVEEEIEVLAMYPNPASENFTISLNNSDTAYEQLSIFDVTGSLIYTQKLSQDTKNIVVPVTNFTPGMHFVKLSGATNSIIKKLIVE